MYNLHDITIIIRIKSLDNVDHMVINQHYHVKHIFHFVFKQLSTDDFCYIGSIITIVLLLIELCMHNGYKTFNWL